MEHHVNSDEAQRKADEFIHHVLQQTADRPFHETARTISNLAFEAGNPVREHFIAAVPTGQS